MSFADDLLERRKSPVALFHRFRTSTNKSNTINLFVEGYHDNLYYTSVYSRSDVSEFFQMKTYITLGKKNLDKVYDLYVRSDIKYRVVGFVRDSDFDFFLGNIKPTQSLFLTCGFSVENYVCSNRALTGFYRSVFGVDPDEVDIESRCASHFLTVDRLFESMAAFFGATMRVSSQQRPVDMDKFDVVSAYNKIREAKQIIELKPNDFKDCLLGDDDFDSEALSVGGKFVSQKSDQWLRGKYLLICTCEFLKTEYETLKIMYHNKEITQFNRASSVDFSKNSVFERMAGGAIPTQHLRDYLGYLAELAAAASAKRMEA